MNIEDQIESAFISNYNYRSPKEFVPILPYKLLFINDEIWKYHTCSRPAFVVREFYGEAVISKNKIKHTSEKDTLVWDLTHIANNFMRGKWDYQSPNTTILPKVSNYDNY